MKKNNQVPAVFLYTAGVLTFLLVLLHLLLGRGDINWLRKVGALMMIVSVALGVVPLFLVKPSGDAGVKTDGLYSWIRHPQYAGYMGLALSLALNTQHVYAWLSATAAVACLYCQAVREEQFMARQYGLTYKNYAAIVPRFNVFKSIFLRKTKHAS